MRYTTYRYNADTCQYERVRTSVGTVVFYALGVLVTSTFILLGLLILHDLVVDSERKNLLQKENEIFARHHAVLSAQLRDLQPILASLESKDQVLHEKFFGSASAVESRIDRQTRQNLLLSDANTFRDHIASLSDISSDLIARAASANRKFGHVLSADGNSSTSMRNLPTLQPVMPWEPERLISGFGPRVNPFHKGLYDHLGVDIAMPRGTPVIATADGTVSQLKRSDLQAGYGNYLEIDHGNRIVTRYAHLEEIQVRYGAKISRGDTIATVGSSGGSVAPHLHYEILRNGQNIDPLPFMITGMDAAEHYVLTVKAQQQNQSLD